MAARGVGCKSLSFTLLQQKPSFELSGKLASETNRVRGNTNYCLTYRTIYLTFLRSLSFIFNCMLNSISFSGVTLLFNEPAEARKPDIKWRLYVFKAGEVLNG